MPAPFLPMTTASSGSGCTRPNSFFSLIGLPWPSSELARWRNHERAASGDAGKDLERVAGPGPFRQRGPHREPQDQLRRVGAAEPHVLAHRDRGELVKVVRQPGQEVAVKVLVGHAEPGA